MRLIVRVNANASGIWGMPRDSKEIKMLGGTSGRPRIASSRGFSAAEIVIVIIVLGLLVVLVVPRLTSAAHADREELLRNRLQALRTHILAYQTEHRGVAPGYPGGNTAMMPTHEAFVAQLTHYTNQAGDAADTPNNEFKFGPYCQRVPQNPLNGNGAIRFMNPVELVPSASGEQGWVYHAGTGTIAANTAGADIHGVKYSEY